MDDTLESPANNLQWIDFVVIGIYFVFVLAVGLYVSTQLFSPVHFYATWGITVLFMWSFILFPLGLETEFSFVLNMDSKNK